jgi:hypothetical protein
MSVQRSRARQTVFASGAKRTGNWPVSSYERQRRLRPTVGATLFRPISRRGQHQVSTITSYDILRSRRLSVVAAPSKLPRYANSRCTSINCRRLLQSSGNRASIEVRLRAGFHEDPDKLDCEKFHSILSFSNVNLLRPGRSVLIGRDGVLLRLINCCSQ